MSTADDLRDLRDALDSIAHGALPRWGTPTTKLGQEAQAAARELYEKHVRALHHESAAAFGVAKARMQVDDYRAHAESLTAKCEKAERERDELRKKAEVLLSERRQLRARLVECRPWVGVCPFPNTPGFTEMLAIRDIADDTLEEVKPWQP